MAESIIADTVIKGIATIANPILGKNANVIASKIQERLFKIDKNDVNIHCTLFNRFKQVYSFDFIQELLLKPISQYRIEEKDCTYKIQDTIFTLIPHFAYTQPDFTDFGLQESEYRVYPDEQERVTFIPGVTGVSIYVFFNQATKLSIVNCQILLDHIQAMLLKELNVKQQGKFLYINTNGEKARDKVMSKIASAYNKDGYVLKNKSGDVNEIKLLYTDTIFRILSGLLKT